MLTDITKALNSTLDLDEVLEKIIDSTIQLADANRGFLMLADDRGVLEFRIARDRDKRPLEMEEFTISFSIVNDAADRGEPLFISDLLDDSRFKDQKSVIDLQLKRAVCVPLLLEKSVIGVIYADSDRLSPAFAKDDMSIISAFASQATIAIENAKLHGKIVHSQETLARENLKLRQELSGKYEFSGFIGRSRSMQEIFLTIQKVASYTTTVLIQGETGTGKELIARAIHFNGSRKDKPLVTINCGAMPKELLESELFGHKKGSFTGAVSDKAGLFETASGGTIFLDEIGEMPLELQVKLLRVLQEGEIRRVGENTDRKVDVRVIAATNRDLNEDVKKGLFRRGSLLPPQRRAHHDSAAPREAGGHHPPRRAFPAEVRIEDEQDRRRDLVGSDEVPPHESLARERPRARELDRARARPVGHFAPARPRALPAPRSRIGDIRSARPRANRSRRSCRRSSGGSSSRPSRKRAGG